MVWDYKKVYFFPKKFGKLKILKNIHDSGNISTDANYDFSAPKKEFDLSFVEKTIKDNSLGFEFKAKKLEKKKLIFSLLKEQFQKRWKESFFDCLPINADLLHGVIKTDNISEHEYDGHAISIINRIGENGIILDCGSGNRPTYYSNVVNFDPVAYETTDVTGVGEELPFKNNSFDAVFSLNVLEHVRDPFKCAKEIARVLKPNGQLYCVAPLLCPYHGYPDHFYNMTKSGLKNLFETNMTIEKQDVLDSGHPIYSLTWILNSWCNGLSPKTRETFLDMSVSELLSDPASYLNNSFVRELSLDKKFELAATIAVWAKKKICNWMAKMKSLKLAAT